MAQLTKVHEKLAVAGSLAMSGMYSGALASFDGVFDEVQRQVSRHELDAVK